MFDFNLTVNVNLKPSNNNLIFFSKNNFINSSLLFTKSNPLASLPDIAEELAKQLNLCPSKVLVLFLQGYWQGFFEKRVWQKSFEKNGIMCFPRLDLLKLMHDIPCLNRYFVFAYKDTEKPATREECEDGTVVVDIRPILPVPNKDTRTWRGKDCREAFAMLADRCQASRDPYNAWPAYVPELMYPVFRMFKISKKRTVSFLKKEKAL